MRALLLSAIPFLFLSPSCSLLPGGSGGSSARRSSEPLHVSCSKGRGRRPKDGCVTATLRCGDQVEGNTAGGASHFDGEFYRGKACIPFDHDYSGPERVYLLELEPRTVADVWLDSDCVDLDLFAARWNYDGRCPTVQHLVPECEGDDAEGGGHVHLETTTHPAQYLVVVDGKGGATGAFGLTVDCAGR